MTSGELEAWPELQPKAHVYRTSGRRIRDDDPRYRLGCGAYPTNLPSTLSARLVDYKCRRRLGHEKPHRNRLGKEW